MTNHLPVWIACLKRYRLQHRYHRIERELGILEDECAHLKDAINRLLRERSQIEVAMIE